VFLGVWRSDDQQPARDEMPRAMYNGVTDDYFRALSIPVVAGRVCGPQDVPGASLNIIVNQLMAERLWPGVSPLGKRIRALDVPVEAVVIGVVGNTRPQLLSDPLRMQLYGCFRQQPGIFATVVVKTMGPPLGVSRSVQQAIWSVDPDQPMWKIRTAETMIRSTVQYDRFVMLLLSLAAGLAIFLAVLGTYSVLSHTVQRRSREVGVRVALGATSGSIVRLILTQTALLVACGLALGVAGSFALRKAVDQQLYEISPGDPGTLIVSAIALGAAALIAAWLPTRRALAVDAIVTLRADS
jgi:putative ABC transport system permease protein